jgi:hypothetical protein
MKITTQQELINFINRKDISKTNALKVARQCYVGAKTFNIPTDKHSEHLYTKEDIINKIKTSPKDLFLLDLPDIGTR